MAGEKESKDKLNLSLIKISKILNKNKFDQWFIGYGTLLGIVRNNSCIDGDDDIDIMCNINDYQKIRSILLKENYELEFGYGINESKRIIKTKASSESASIDFYMTDVDDNGNFNDVWEGVIWSNCYSKNSKEFIKFNWENTTLNLPANYYKKLKKRYGIFWRIPQKNKGNQSYKDSIIKKILKKIYYYFLSKSKGDKLKIVIKKNKFYKFISLKRKSKI
jgi:hypothetical protein